MSDGPKLSTDFVPSSELLADNSHPYLSGSSPGKRSYHMYDPNNNKKGNFSNSVVTQNQEYKGPESESVSNLHGSSMPLDRGSFSKYIKKSESSSGLNQLSSTLYAASSLDPQDITPKTPTSFNNTKECSDTMSMKSASSECVSSSLDLLIIPQEKLPLIENQNKCGKNRLIALNIAPYVSSSLDSLITSPEEPPSFMEEKNGHTKPKTSYIPSIYIPSVSSSLDSSTISPEVPPSFRNKKSENKPMSSNTTPCVSSPVPANVSTTFKTTKTSTISALSSPSSYVSSSPDSLITPPSKCNLFEKPGKSKYKHSSYHSLSRSSTNNSSYKSAGKACALEFGKNHEEIFSSKLQSDSYSSSETSTPQNVANRHSYLLDQVRSDTEDSTPVLISHRAHTPFKQMSSFQQKDTPTNKINPDFLLSSLKSLTTFSDKTLGHVGQDVPLSFQMQKRRLLNYGSKFVNDGSYGDSNLAGKILTINFSFRFS